MSTCAAGCAEARPLQVLLDGIRDHGIYLLDPKGTVVTWSAGAEQLKGYCADEVVGRNFDIFYTPEDRESGHPEYVLARCRETGRYEESGWRVCKDGTRFWASILLTAIRDDAGRVVGFGKITRDMTERLHESEERADLVARLADAKAEQRRAEVEAQLHQAQRLDTVGQLAGGIAHDFNNLLAAIMSYAALLSRELEEASSAGATREKAAEMLADANEITTVAAKAANLTRQLLIFSRRDIVTVERLDLNQVVVEVERLLRRTLGEAIRLTVDLATQPTPVDADRGQLEQVIMNLAVNARDAMPEGGALHITTRNVVVRADDASADRIELAVQDTGHGMPPEVMRRALEPYFTTKSRGEGTGLGLSIVHGIVTSAGGTVEIESAADRGSKFIIALPVSTREQHSSPARVVSERSRIVGGSTILLAEDERAVREPVRRLLSRSGYTVIAARNASEALGLFEELDRPIDLLLTDVVMPGGSGRDLARMIVAQQPAAKVLYMTGYGEDVISHRGVLAPDVAVISKPFTATTLLTRVREALKVTSEAADQEVIEERS